MTELKRKQPFKLMDCVTFAVTLFFIAYYFLRLFGFFIDAITFVIPLLLAGIYMILTMHWSERVLEYIIGIIALLVGITLVEMLCTNALSLVSFVSMFKQNFMNMFPLYLAYSVLKSKNRRLVVWILVTITVILAYVLVITFIELGKDDRFMREMSINYTNYREYNVTNAGGFQFAYAMAILVGLLISLFLLNYKHHSRLRKFGLLIALVASFLLVVNSSYTLAMMICIIIVFIAVTLQMRKTYTKAIFWLVGVLCFLAILSLSEAIVALVPTDEMKLRLSEVFAFLKSGDVSGYNLSGRFSLYWRAIKAFFKRPLVGNASLGFDPHSSILRFFAKDGILGGVGYLLLYYFGYRIVVKYFLGDSKKKLFKPAFVALILMGIVNPIHSVGAVHYIVFFVAPLALALVKTGEEENETSLGN